MTPDREFVLKRANFRMATLTSTQDADVFDNYGDNYLVVTNDGDTIFGLGGNDYVGAGTGGDHIFGGEGNDELYSGSGDDVVEGGNGNDRLVDGPGDDIENGGPGDDSIEQLGATDDDHDIGNGGPGNDSLYTSSEPFGVTLGTAILHGDEGNDTIIMSLHGEAYGDDDDDQLGGGSTALISRVAQVTTGLRRTPVTTSSRVAPATT